MVLRGAIKNFLELWDSFHDIFILRCSLIFHFRHLLRLLLKKLTNTVTAVSSINKQETNRNKILNENSSVGDGKVKLASRCILQIIKRRKIKITQIPPDKVQIANVIHWETNLYNPVSRFPFVEFTFVNSPFAKWGV